MRKLLFSTLLLSGFFAMAQQANDCVDAIVVCGNTNISTNVSGFGIQELDSATNPCTSEERNSLWLNVTIETAGSLAFIIRPDDTDLVVDYDFYIFGPNDVCNNLNSPIRCNTTNPLEAGLDYNITGLRDSETETSGGPGSDGNAFVSSIPVTAGEQYYILVERPIGDGGFSLEWTGTAGFQPAPQITSPVIAEFCGANSSSLIDLTQDESRITTSTIASIAYYSNYNNAFDATNPIPDPSQYTYSGSATTIYVRVTNPNGCFEIAEYQLFPILFDGPADLSYEVCDTDRDGLADFSITDIISDGEKAIINIMEFGLSIHQNETDAITNANSITNPTITTGTTTLYARVTSALAENCFITYPIPLTVNSSEFPAMLNLVQCDVDEANSVDGITNMDLEQAFENTGGTTILYYETEADRTADNPIANPDDYTNITPFNTVIYYRVASNTCESLGELQIEVSPTTVSLNSISPLQTCDDNPNDDVLESAFDLEGIRQNNYAGLDVAFYENLNDVSLEQNPLDGSYRTTSTTLYVRIEANNQCQGVEEIELIVNPLPEVTLEENYEVCTDGDPIVIEAPTGFDSYTWFRIDGGEMLEVSTNEKLSTSDGGNYRLEVEIQYQNNGEVTRCEASADFTVTPSNIATIQEIEVEQLSDDTIVHVVATGDGDYEYSLDGINYQDESRFNNVDAGFYTVFVRDKNGCGTAEEEISVIGFPKFFTPNGDGANDNWQIIGTNSNFAERPVHIFDRYGRLVKQISTNSIGWDGMMNGTRLPSSDYWFRLTLDNGKEFQGHFSLKR